MSRDQTGYLRSLVSGSFFLFAFFFGVLLVAPASSQNRSSCFVNFDGNPAGVDQSGCPTAVFLALDDHNFSIPIGPVSGNSTCPDGLGNPPKTDDEVRDLIRIVISAAGFHATDIGQTSLLIRRNTGPENLLACAASTSDPNLSVTSFHFLLPAVLIDLDPENDGPTMPFGEDAGINSAQIDLTINGLTTSFIGFMPNDPDHEVMTRLGARLFADQYEVSFGGSAIVVQATPTGERPLFASISGNGVLAVQAIVPPTCLSVTPLTGFRGSCQTVTLTGAGFGLTTEVFFGNTGPAVRREMTENREIIVEVPRDAPPGEVTVGLRDRGFEDECGVRFDLGDPCPTPLPPTTPANIVVTRCPPVGRSRVVELCGSRPTLFRSARIPGAHDVTLGPFGKFYVSGGEGGAVFRIDGRSGQRDLFVPNGEFGIVFGSDGNLYVSQGDRIDRFDGVTGDFIDIFAQGPEMDSIDRITFGPNGNLYVGCPTGNEILRYDGNTGTFLGGFTLGGGLDTPRGLTFGRDGNLYVASQQTDNVLRYEGFTGAFLGVFASGIPRPNGLDFGRGGDLYVVSETAGGVFQFDGVSGELLERFDPSGVRDPVGIAFFPVSSFLVSNTNDRGPGSLRRAIADANADLGLDIIVFETGGTINLQSALPGLSDDLCIDGPGAQCLTVRRDDAAGSFRIFNIAMDVRVVISGLTVANGRSDRGGGIHSRGFLTIDSCIVRDNEASLSGGGIEASRGNQSGTLTIRNTAILNNTARDDGGGGLQYGHGSTTGRLTNCTVSGNMAEGFGGGIRCAKGIMELRNCTVTGNRSGSQGGGLSVRDWSIQLFNCIVAGNSAVTRGPDAALEGSGGGFGSFRGNVIGVNEDVEARFAPGRPNSRGDFVGTAGSPLQAGLRPLGDYGGPTPTHALSIDSIAIDVGATESTRLPTVDQRGRARSQNGDCNPGSRPDSGAFELDDCRGGNVNAAGLAIVFGDDMEEGDSNWATASPTRNGNWAILPTINACSVTNAWFSSNISAVKDDRLELRPIVIPYGCSVLKFSHFYNLEASDGDPSLGFDGAVLEASIDGGPFEDLGPFITDGGYNSVISDLFGSPIRGRPAWSGSGNICDEVAVDLTSFMGAIMVFRFRLACDATQSAEGWTVDDVRICESLGDAVKDVLFINGSAGTGFNRTVEVGLGQPINIELRASAAGPIRNVRYFLYAWPGLPSNPTLFRSNGSDLGILVNPGPIQGGNPQPVLCLVGTGIAPSVCGSVSSPPAPVRAPFSMNGTGRASAMVMTMQGVIEDFGSLNAERFSTTNAVVLDVQ